MGTFPQCGFSVTAATLYASRVITLGTLVAVFLTTSDEAIPVLLSHPDCMPLLLKVIGLKLIIGIVIGFIIDLIFRKKHTPIEEKKKRKNIFILCVQIAIVIIQEFLNPQ